ncbi:hypothetical protein CYMTET_39492 [Cymbomonas tetramitiformis]|uniref:Transmembrane protein n=1 Tax=Cymbomonas tetramitiformis TaxID=36881 RepID=A0AAE0CC27_9CHLO|nr:hypothetical protein CYMTET_39492 [Cymbomonas tetramitiformis]
MRDDQMFTQLQWGTRDAAAPWVLPALESLEARRLPTAAPPALQVRVAERPEHVDERWTRNVDEREGSPDAQPTLWPWAAGTGSPREARLDKPRFAARWAQLRRNLQLHRFAQAAYLVVVLALVVSTAAGWQANVAEQDEVLPYTVLDELQPLGDTTVTKDEAAWLDTELNATFGGHPDFKEEH